MATKVGCSKKGLRMAEIAHPRKANRVVLNLQNCCVWLQRRAPVQSACSYTTGLTKDGLRQAGGLVV